MNIKDFLTASVKATRIIENASLSTLYSKLAETLTAARQSPTAESQKQVNDAIQNIVKSNLLIEHEVSQIPHGQHLIRILKLDSLIGEGASGTLLSKIGSETYLAPDAIIELNNNTANALTRITTIINTFSEFGLEASAEDSVVLSIEYGQKYDEVNTAELRSKLYEIEQIAHAFARLTNEPRAFSKPQVKSISKSSPLIIDFGNGVETAATILLIAKAVAWSMDRIEQLYDIRIKRESLRNGKITNKKIEEGFDELEKKMTSEQSIKTFVNKLIRECNPTDADNSIGGADEEVKKALVHSMGKIINLVEEGSAINVFIPADATVLPEDTEPSEVTLNIATGMKSIRGKQNELSNLLSSGEDAKYEDELDDINDEDE